jgi:type I restriction enzyme S subunit
LKDRNKNRPGYKKTKVGWIPEEWGTASLCDVANVFFSNVDKKTNSNENDVLLCNYKDVYYNEHITSEINFMRATASDRQIDKYRLRNGDVLITKDSETKDDIAVSAIVREEVSNLICGYHLAIIRPDINKLSGEYLNKLFDLQTMKHHFSILANGVTRFGLTLNSVNSSLIHLPSLSEQKKIAKILSTWDEAIEQTRKLIDVKKRRKKALMQQLLTGKMRFKDNGGNDWCVRPLGELVEPVLRPVPKPKEPYLSIGLRSHGRGTFQKIVELPEKVMMDTLYRIESQDIIVNITFAWEGAIAIAKEKDSGGLVSHRFPTYRIKDKKANIDFFRNLILTKKFVWDLGLISPGGAGRNRVMNKRNFLKLKVLLPPVKIQKELGKILTTADNEIKILEEYRNAVNKQKRGLMQKLLTGEVRAKS